jgi:hypothetical protein
MLGTKSRLMLSQARADSGEFVRISYGEKCYRYYPYDLRGWALAKWST